MKKIFLVFFILLSTLVTSQTKSETQEWIISKLELYAYEHPPHTIKKVKIENNKIYFFNSYGMYQSINIKDIYQILVEKKQTKDNIYGLTLFCKNKSNCVTDGEFNGNVENPRDSNYNSMMFIYLRNSFGQDDLPKRMEKAFLHLIKLYGGNAKLYKEAF